MGLNLFKKKLISQNIIFNLTVKIIKWQKKQILEIKLKKKEPQKMKHKIIKFSISIANKIH